MKMKLMALLVLCSVFTSCAGGISGITGAPIPSTPVQRVSGEGKPFNVATADVYRAETDPESVFGLYNASRVAKTVKQVTDSGK